MEKKFDTQSLAENNGQEGKPVFIAHEGKVYDVSESKLWRGGQHMKRHQAGEDLSAAFADAPHGPEVFDRYPQIGTLQGEPSPRPAEKQELPPWLEDILERFPLLARHPHPALVHFPIAFLFGAPLFTLLALAAGHDLFETTAFHLLGAALLMTPLTIISGFFTWWLNYQGHLMKPIRIKIMGSVVLMLLILGLFAWRYIAPGLVFSGGVPRMLYLLLLLSLLPLVSVVGWYGATLTFPTGKE